MVPGAACWWAVAGAALLAVGAISDRDEDCRDCFVDGKGLALLAAVPLAGLTTLVGGVIGGIHPGERWNRVHGPVRTAPSTEPAGGTR
ncbi:MAG: hypothetical protein JWM27_31 [Gemmatimonadetes bacterium]|nr:hypothetical protein [Gemmatimonadota bacterium]